MKIGDLVCADNYCAGLAGSLRCETSLIIDVWHNHTEQVQVDTHTYIDRDVYKCALMCNCGMFEEEIDRLSLVNEDR